jgi:TolB-like protein
MSDSRTAVFLSYASQDATAAAEITRALRAGGIEVWFDQSELRGGDAWDASIRRQIKACSLFIPVISKNTHAREEGYFRLEWKLAVDRTHLMAASKTFLLPVVIDDTRDDDDRVPDRFRDVQWTRLPDGRTPPSFVERVAKLLTTEKPPDAAGGLAPPARLAAPDGIAASTANVVAAGIVSKSRGNPTRALPWIAIALIIIVGGVEMYRVLGSKRDAGPAVAVPVPSASMTAPSTGAANATDSPVPAAIPEKSIAVLPFVDMSEKKDQEYFSDGLAEELLDLLAQIRDLHVAARTSSFSFKSKSDDIASIAKKLRVANLLEGSVRRSGDVIRVSAQLIRADNGYDLWSKTYDRQVKDIFKVQDEIAGAVVDALKVQLMPSQQLENRHRTVNTEAYGQYLLGNQARAMDGLDTNPKALVAYQKAVSLDPAYAAAYAGIADAEWRIADQSSNDPIAYARATSAADKAIVLAPESPEGYWARGQLKYLYYWDWKAAKLDFDRALALDPGFAPVYGIYADLLATVGQPSEAVAMFRKALALDPLSTFTLRHFARLQLDYGQFDEVYKAVRVMREINPRLDPRVEGYGQLRQGRLQEALVAFQASGSPLRLQGIAMAEYSLGHKDASDRALAEIIRTHGNPFSYQYAEAYAWRGDIDEALQWLETAYRVHDGGLTYIGYDRFLDKLRGDPRFNTLLRKMNLAPDQTAAAM